MRFVYEPHVNMFVLHVYNILTSLVLWYEVHMNLIRTECKFIWINLIWFHMKFMLHMKFIWTSHEFHTNKLDFISYEIHEKFIWTSYEVHATFTINFYVVQMNFIWGCEQLVSYGLHMNEPPGPSYDTPIDFDIIVLQHFHMMTSRHGNAFGTISPSRTKSAGDRRAWTHSSVLCQLSILCHIFLINTPTTAYFQYHSIRTSGSSWLLWISCSTSINN